MCVCVCDVVKDNEGKSVAERNRENKKERKSQVKKSTDKHSSGTLISYPYKLDFISFQALSLLILFLIASHSGMVLNYS